MANLASARSTNMDARLLLSSLTFVLMGVGLLAWTYHRQPSQAQSNGAPRVLYYVDPMHPSYRSNHPGTAPDCGMALEAVYEQQPTGERSRSAELHVKAETQQLIGLKLGHPEVKEGSQTFRTIGRVVVDETRLYRITAATEGWMQTVGPHATGSFVRQEEELGSFYTRDLRSAVQAYLYTSERLNASPSPRPGDTQLDERALDLSIEGLRNLGMSLSQIAELKATRNPPAYVSIRSPASGFILLRNVSPQQRFERGEELFRIADLRRVWVLADIFENAAALLGPTQPDSVRVVYGSHSLPAKISKALPAVDPLARNLKLRLEVDNTRFLLKPDLYVDVELSISRPASLTVPASAVLMDRNDGTVFVSKGQGYFEPRRVKTGWTSQDRIEIISGIGPEDEIVVSGNFLLDADLRLKSAPQQ
jgi:membrane fusion protein, copper/silver efflux system